MKPVVFVWLSLLALACSKNEEPAPLPERKEEDLTELWQYVDEFIEEGAKRNVSLDKSKLQLQFFENTTILSASGYGSPDPLRVMVSKTFWYNASLLHKELLMFHEIGHAMLARNHHSEEFPNCSDHKSLMHAKGHVFYKDNDDPKRKYYLDELFNPKVEPPAWAGEIKPNETPLLTQLAPSFTASAGSKHTGTISPDRSWHINSRGIESGFSSWRSATPSHDIPAGATIVVNGKMKYSDIKAEFKYQLESVVDILLTATPPDELISTDIQYDGDFQTTLGTYWRDISGTSEDWVPFKLTINCYPADKPQMYVYLYMGSYVTGDVWFKDVSVDYYN